MWKASIFKIVRLAATWFFFGADTKNGKKTIFFHKTLISENLLKEANIQARSMWKLTSWQFRKCGTYWACHVFNGSYRPSKMDESEKNWSVPENKRCPKKETRPQFWKLRLEIESALKQPCWSHADSISEAKTQNCGRVFFFGHLLSLKFVLQFLPNFDGQ